MVNKVRIWVQNDRIKIHERCQEIIGCLENAIWKENRREFDRSAVFGHYDALAALIYLVRNVNENVNPIPKLHKISDNTHWINESKRTTKTKDTLRKMFNKKKR